MGVALSSRKKKRRGVECVYSFRGSGKPITSISTNDPRPKSARAFVLFSLVLKIYQTFRKERIRAKLKITGDQSSLLCDNWAMSLGNIVLLGVKIDDEECF